MSVPKEYDVLVNTTIGGKERKAGETFTDEQGLVQSADIRDGLVREITARVPATVSDDKPPRKPTLSKIKPRFGRKGAGK